MDGTLFHSHLPFRPIPIYGQHLPDQFKIMPTLDARYQLKKTEESPNFVKDLSVISQMSGLQAFGECPLGQIHPLRDHRLNNFYQGLAKYYNITELSQDGKSATNNAAGDLRQTTDVPLTTKSTSSSQNTSRLSVPIIMPSNDPFQSQYGYGRKIFPCPHCRYTTDRRNNLKRHMLTMHQTCSKILECCGLLFATKASLREHAMIFHYHGYTCFYCGRRFCRKALLKRHLSVHNGQKEFVCSVCDYATSHKSNLERHRKVHCRTEDEKSGNESECNLDKVSTSNDMWNPDKCSALKQTSDERDFSSGEESEEINVDSDD
ncbi:hypothetical protein CHS0354_027274 [Potamilus streckersoni]|uniref:C2H2-type domain-containing protein n=1 Tax=Potamilus streckersoni TaxID=2493646 RepID=A0AAE0W9P4_9BIVA|nr:hypothetical protein CHS0354_027274 [Potamilus streckersoni]